MWNQRKYLLRSNRLAYQNAPQSGQAERFEESTDEKLKEYAKTTEQNVRDRMELQVGINDVLAPIQAEKKVFDETVDEMNRERLQKLNQ